MSLAVFAAVIFSAFFQGGWNFFAKKSSANKIALLAIGWFLFGILLLPLALYQTPISHWDPSWIKYFVASGVIHSFYVIFLGWGYSIGEVSVVYPIARGLGILGTSLVSFAFGLHEFSTLGVAGLLSIVTGTFLIGLKEVPSRETRKAFWVAILIGITVTTYSIVDSRGAQHVPPLLYVVMMDIMTTVFVSPWLMTRMRGDVRNVLQKHKIEALMVAGAGTISYFIILWAYSQTPASYVAALREFSVVIASTLGLVVLRERLYKRKLLAIGAIVIGVVLLKMA